jgi:hypothetical protein
MTTTHADKIAYCNCMEQVKRRLRLTRTLTSGAVRTGDEGADAEFACLQLRKALELLAFAALSANRECYAKVRADVENEWRAKQILDRLRQKHPDFYPVPVVRVSQGPGRWHFDRVTDGFLTEEEFVFLYDKCSEAVHEWNPFRPGPRFIDLERSIEQWAGRIERLLEFHYIRLVGQADLLLVHLEDPSDRKAHVFTAAGLTSRSSRPA